MRPLLLAASVGLASCAAPPESLAGRLRAAAVDAPLVVAHRGDSAEHPENTLPAFRAALSAGADIVELDFHQTRDGELLCIHDETLDRTTDAAAVLGRERLRVDQVDLEQVRRLDAGAWKGEEHAGARVPTLRAALELIRGGAVAMVEHKAGDPATLVDLLRRLRLVEGVLVQSFDWDWLEQARRLEPRLVLGALGSRELTEEKLGRIRDLGVVLVHWNARDLRVEDVDRLRRLGLLVCVYTVDDDLSLLGAGALGVDAVTTNRPEHLRALVSGGVVRRR